MSKPRYASPRDANEAELLAVAVQLGGHWNQAPPLDGWLWVPRLGRWLGPIEIKIPEREGLAHEYTPAQKRFFTWCQQHGAPWLIWRTPEDVIKDLSGRVAAGVGHAGNY